jgi:predicted metal-dependent hydrolase
LVEAEIILDGRAVPYVVKRSSRARHVRLEMRQGSGLAVVIPRTYPVERVAQVLKEKKRWIMGNLARYSEVSQASIRQEIKAGDVVSYLGRQLVVAVRGRRGVDAVKLERGKLVVSSTSPSEGLNSVLEQWYRAQAATLLQEKVEKWGAELGLNHTRVTIRGQRTRWGSCSRKGNLSFNWKLMMVPETVIDYVVIHELAHLKEMNHSKRFWRLVAQHCSEWQDCKKWLRTHEAELNTGLFARQMPLSI